MAIYEEIKDVKWGWSGTLGEVCLKDFAVFEQKGIRHKNLPAIKAKLETYVAEQNKEGKD